MVAPLLAGKVTVLLGHSGVGKSTLVNRLVPDADRATGDVAWPERAGAADLPVAVRAQAQAQPGSTHGLELARGQ